MKTQINAVSRGSAGVVSLLILTGILAGSCLPAGSQTYDLSRDFSATSNPNGAWSYGYETAVGGPFALWTVSYQAADNGGALIDIWAVTHSGPSQVDHNGSNITGSSDGGQGTFPPGTTWFYPGYEGNSDNFGTIRFTVPPGQAGTYLLESAVHSYLDGPISGDTDFHVVKDGAELFGQFLPGSSGTGYTNTLTLGDGDTIDFLVGRGLDNHLYASGLKIQATLNLKTTNPVAPFIVVQPQGQTVTAGASVTFSVGATGSSPLSYQWGLDGSDLDGANAASLTLNNVQASDAGNYSVAVSNALGDVTSVDAALTVNPRPVQSTYDLAREFSRTSNPNGVWSYGWKPTLSGNFTPWTQFYQAKDNAGALIDIWAINHSGPSQVDRNGSNITGGSDGGQGTFPPGTVWFYPGYEGNVDNFGAIRFTVPPGGSGNYDLATAVHSYLDGPSSGDTDFHVVNNGVELFGQFLPGSSGTGYTNTLTLGDGDTIDFVVGRGVDNHLYASGLKIQATLNLTTTNPVAPFIVVQPQGQTVTAGASVTFSVGATGSSPLSYQWGLDGSDLDGANAASLTLNNVQASDAGAYSVTVSNAVGGVTSADATLTVNPPPVQSTYDLARDFSRTANPNGVWSYGWKPTLSGNFTPWTQFYQAKDNAGALIDIWAINHSGPSQVDRNGSNITGGSDGGQGTFPPGTVWFYPGYEGNVDNFGAIRFTVPPGQSGTYLLESAVHSYLDGPISGDTDFHVVKDGVELFGQFLPGSSGTGYTNTLTLGDGDTIDFLVGRGLDNHLYASGLKIQATLNLTATNPVAPSIVVQPQSQTVTVGASVTFGVNATGSSPLSYQWRLNGNDIDSANAASLTLNNVQASDAGNYSVAVSNALGDVTSVDAALTVNPRPVQSTYDLAREFSRTSNPNGAWSYGWKPALSGNFTLWTQFYQALDNAGALIDIWAINHSGPSQVDHNGSNTTGGSDGGQGTFPPGTTWFYPGYEGNSDNFGTIRFTVPAGASGTYNLKTAVHSYLDGPSSGDTDFHVVKNGVELFGQFLPGSSGTGYTNTLTLGDGDTIDFLVGRGLDNHLYASGLKIQATLDLVDTNPVAPTIIMQPQSRTVAIGGSVTFNVSADGTAPLSYQWSFNGTGIDGATGGSLTLHNVQPTDAGNYSVTISNVVSSVTSADAVLTVSSTGAPPAIDSEPAGDNVEIGASATFTVSASGSEPLGYQWFFDGTAISGATSNSLTIASVQAGDAGTYWVVVSNPFGSVRSMGAVLYISSGGGGSVNFSNLGISHVYDVDGTTRLPAGTAFLAQLYAGPAAGSLQAVAGTASFVFPGLFDGGTRYIPSVAPGQVASVQVRVWETAYGTTYEQARTTGGRTGTSPILQVRTGGGGIPPSVPAELVGLQNFSLAPGLPPQALVFIGRNPVAFLTELKKIPSGQFQFTLSGDAGAVFTIEASTDLMNWTPITNVVNSSGAVPIVDPDAANRSHRFYRARPAGQ